MTYTEALEKIHGLLHFGSRPGLDRILKLLDFIGNPQDKCKFVHVAGTNGKGSVCQMISSALFPLQSMLCKFRISFAGGYTGLPTPFHNSSVLVAYEVTTKSPSSPFFFTISLKINSAIGERQMLP